MSVNVYWTCLDTNWVGLKHPDSVIQTLNRSNLKKSEEQGTKPGSGISNMNYCPALQNELKNTYNIYSIYNYEFTASNNEVYSLNYTQEFFNDHVNLRSVEQKLFSYYQGFIFFTDDDSLEMSLMPPYLEDNNINKNCIVIPGKFDIGKWFRIIDYAFFLKRDSNTFKVEQNEVMYYLKFNTNESINLKQFFASDKIKQYAESCSKLSKTASLRTLQNYYNQFRFKKLILKEIKNNLCV